MASGFLLRGGKVQRLDDGPKQHIDWRRLGDPRRNATPEDLNQRGVGAGCVREHFGGGNDSVEFVQQDQAAQMLDGVFVFARPWPHRVPGLGPQRDENVGDHQVKRVLVKRGDGFFD